MSASSGGSASSEDAGRHDRTFSSFSRRSRISSTGSSRRLSVTSIHADNVFWPGLQRNAGVVEANDAAVPVEYFHGERRRGRCVWWSSEEKKAGVVDEEWGNRHGTIVILADHIHADDFRNPKIRPGEQVEYTLCCVGDDLFGEWVTGLLETPCGSADSLALSGAHEQEQSAIVETSRLGSRAALRLNFLRAELRRYRRPSRSDVRQTPEQPQPSDPTAKMLKPLVRPFRAVLDDATASSIVQEKRELCWAFATTGKCQSRGACRQAHSLVEISGSLVDHSSHKTSPVCPIVAPPAVVSVPTFDIHATFSLARPLVSLPRLSRRFQRPAQRPYPAPATPTVRLPLHKAVNVSTSRPSSAAAPSALGKGTQRETKTARHFTKGKKRTIAAPLGNATVPAARSTQSATSLKAVETSMTPLTQAMPVATQKARNRHQLKSKKRSAS